MTSTSPREACFEMLKGKEKIRILFVCLGNICRSPAAEGIMRSVVAKHGEEDRWVIDSAGTGDWHVGDLPDSRMRAAGVRHGYRFEHRCRQISRDDFNNFDLIIGMDDQNIRNLSLIAPDSEAKAKIQHIGDWLHSDECTYVPDPYYGTERDFDFAISLLEKACKRIFDQLS